MKAVGLDFALLFFSQPSKWKLLTQGPDTSDMTASTFGIYYDPDIMRLAYKNEIIIKIFFSSFH